MGTFTCLLHRFSRQTALHITSTVRTLYKIQILLALGPVPKSSESFTMSSSLLHPPAHLPPSVALSLSQQAPALLQSIPSAISSYSVSSLWSQRLPSYGRPMKTL